jgi:hypothetical protein
MRGYAIWNPLEARSRRGGIPRGRSGADPRRRAGARRSRARGFALGPGLLRLQRSADPGPPGRDRERRARPGRGRLERRLRLRRLQRRAGHACAGTRARSPAAVRPRRRVHLVRLPGVRRQPGLAGPPRRDGAALQPQPAAAGRRGHGTGQRRQGADPAAGALGRCGCRLLAGGVGASLSHQAVHRVAMAGGRGDGPAGRRRVHRGPRQSAGAVSVPQGPGGGEHHPGFPQPRRRARDRDVSFVAGYEREPWHYRIGVGLRLRWLPE